MYVSNDSFDWRKEALALWRSFLGGDVLNKIGEGRGHKMGTGLMEQHRGMRKISGVELRMRSVDSFYRVVIVIVVDINSAFHVSDSIFYGSLDTQVGC